MQPCIEINSRMNMGVLTMFIEKQIHPDATGKFELFYGKTGDFETYALKQIQLKKPQFSEGRLYSGFVTLVEPSKQNKFGAYISLGEAK